MNTMKKLIVGGLAALASGLAGAPMAPTASADPLFYTNEGQFIGEVYSNGVQAWPGTTTADLVQHGYWMCELLGNHSGGYVTSQVWSINHSTGLTWSMADVMVRAAIANLCPWRWY